MKTLQQVEPRTPIGSLPFTITAAGAYYLTTNLTGLSGQSGILIQADNITLDLRGFQLTGVLGSLDGIVATNNNIRNLIIRNGGVNSWRQNGINIRFAGNGVLIQAITASLNSLNGILAGGGAVIRQCNSHDNNGAGIVITNGDATVSDCVANLDTGGGIIADSRYRAQFFNCSVEGCAGDGIVGGGLSLVHNCSANFNTHGIIVGGSSTVSDCIASENSSDGIYAPFGAALAGCAVSFNSGDGINAGVHSSLQNCEADNNIKDGIFASDGSTLADCSSVNNSGNGLVTGSGCTISYCSVHNNTLNGISTTYGCTVTGTSARLNTQTGINLSDACTVQDCTAQGNKGDGIQATRRCRIVNNMADFNGTFAGGTSGMGFHTTADNNRIESNTATYNDTGFLLNGVASIVLRNTATGNTTNYVIAANNKVGVIVAAPVSGAISGPTGGSGLGTTDPTANFSY